MKYMGSKRRLAKYILPIILKDRAEDQTFVDVFCGGANLVDKVPGKRIANDLNEYIIATFKALQEGWVPPGEVTEEEYNNIKKNKEAYPKHLVGFVGVCCSFASIWLGCYARGRPNFAAESKRNLIKQLPNIQGILFTTGDYADLEIPPNSIIYCDPPYKGTSKGAYKTKNFDYERFYSWCEEKHKEGHTIFISEYAMPEDRFVCVYERTIPVHIYSNRTSNSKAVEKLFIVKDK